MFYMQTCTNNLILILLDNTVSYYNKLVTYYNLNYERYVRSQVITFYFFNKAQIQMEMKLFQFDSNEMYQMFRIFFCTSSVLVPMKNLNIVLITMIIVFKKNGLVNMFKTVTATYPQVL